MNTTEKNLDSYIKTYYLMIGSEVKKENTWTILKRENSCKDGIKIERETYIRGRKEDIE